jgi:hypothetical protein
MRSLGVVGPGRLRSFAHPTQESDLPQLIVGRSAGLALAFHPGCLADGGLTVKGAPELGR